MNIIGKKIILRAIEEDDLVLLHKWANDPQTQDIMGDIHFPSSIDFHKEWYKKIKDDNLNLRLAIDTGIGLIGLSTIINIDWKNKHAWHGIMLGDKDIRGKGYGIDTVMTTMRYAFDEMGLERLESSIIEYNLISYSLYCKKLGWKQEGIKINHKYSKGKFWNIIMIGITKDDYKELVEKTGYWNE